MKKNDLNLKFSDANILVIGDVMLDKYYVGSVDRISPESPVPVVKINNEHRVPGGAANVVNNIIGLKSNVHLIGVTGKDVFRDYLLQIFEERNISAHLLETDAPTITKIRVIGNHQQVVRLDFEEINKIKTEIEDEIKSIVDRKINEYNVVIISDYAKGLCTDKLCEYIISKANSMDIPVIVDPKGSNWEKYKNASFVTPNVKEIGDLLGISLKNENSEIEKYGHQVLEMYSLKNLLVTRSDKGMTLINKDCVIHIPTEAKEVYDVSGAGDTVVASIAVSIALENGVKEAIKIANKAAGVVVSKFGTAPILEEELVYALFKETDNKIISKEYLTFLIPNLRAQGKKIAFTNGCFDILHKGHVAYLKKGKNLADILILGLNTDLSVKRLKGDGRPINSEMDRAEVLAALEYVDFVVLFDEDTPYQLIKSLKPDILLKGADYNIENVVGREFAKETILIDFEDGYSTTTTIDKINKE